MSDEPVGRAKGGVARAQKLSPEQRSSIAKAAATARWGKLPTATHIGNFQKEFGIDVECYVLADAQKTTVISQIGMARVLGLSPRGNSFPNFINSAAMANSVGGELRLKIENPVRFQYGTGGGGAIRTAINGFDTALLIDVCNAIISAENEGKLRAVRYERVVQQAHIIIGTSAKDGMRQLVYALAGYSPSTEEVIAAFKLYIRDEARKYEAEFPNELYVQWHRLYEMSVIDRGKRWHFENLTVNHIYYPLAQSSGKLLNLLRASKAKDGDRQKKIFQFLSEVGTRALRMHLGRVLEMAESSPDKHAYERRIAERFGSHGQFGFGRHPHASSAP